MSTDKLPATFLKEEIEALILSRYKNLSAYETIGALEVVKQAMLDALNMDSSES